MPIRLCYGTFATALLLCKKLRTTTQAQLNCALISSFYYTDVEELSSDAPKASNYFNCKRPLESGMILEALVLAKSPDKIRKMKERFKVNVLSLLDSDKIELAALTICNIIINDPSIHFETVVDIVNSETKNTIMTKEDFKSDGFLAGVFLFSIISSENTVGKDSISKITGGYLGEIKAEIEKKHFSKDSSVQKSLYYQEIYEKTIEVYIEYENKLLRKAEEGDAKSQYLLARYYYTGNFVFSLNYNEAFKWACRAEKQNYAPAQDLKGTLCYKGCGTEQSFEEAFKLHKKSVENGYTLAYWQTAFMLNMGLGCEQSFEESVKLLKKGIENGYFKLNYELGLIYEENNRKLDKSLSLAIQYYEKIADYSGDACYRLGMIYCDGINGKSDYQEAVKWFQKAADKNSTAAIQQIGRMHYFGLGLPKSDFKEARRLYEQAAQKGNGDAQYVLGYLYLFGLGGKIDEEMAFVWLKKAAYQGNFFSQRHLGDIYMRRKDYEAAFEMFRLSAAQGDVISQCRLGDLYALGLGIGQQSFPLAISYYKLAAQQGDVYAKSCLELKSYPLLNV